MRSRGSVHSSSSGEPKGLPMPRLQALPAGQVFNSSTGTQVLVIPSQDDHVLEVSVTWQHQVSASAQEWLYVHFGDCSWIALCCNMLALAILWRCCLAMEASEDRVAQLISRVQHPFMLSVTEDSLLLSHPCPFAGVQQSFSEPQLPSLTHSLACCSLKTAILDLFMAQPPFCVCWLCAGSVVFRWILCRFAVLWHSVHLWSHSCPIPLLGGLWGSPSVNLAVLFYSNTFWGRWVGMWGGVGKKPNSFCALGCQTWVDGDVHCWSHAKGSSERRSGIRHSAVMEMV
jgi:hypothetical protein